VTDNLTLPNPAAARGGERAGQASEDQEIGQELVECNRRLGELREEVAEFLGQRHPGPCLLVERSGKAQRSVALNAAPLEVAGFLRRRLLKATLPSS